jgi:CheY-like chemotaxis protein
MASLLMVDHAPLFRLLESTCARRSGWSLRSALTAEDLLKKARAERPDVIVLSGPVADAAFASRLRSEAGLAAVPILAIGQGSDVPACAGADAALAWPAAEAEIEASLATLMHETRRAACRRAVRQPAQVTSGGAPGAGAATLRGRLRDIAAGGAFVTMQQGPPAGTAVQLEFRLGAGEPPFRAAGLVVRRVEEDAASHRVAGVAIRFTDADPNRTRRIEAFVRDISPGALPQVPEA